MNELVTVIIPAYNHQNYVCEAIESVIKQDYKNWNLILIDDQSSDNTYQQAFNYVSSLPDLIQEKIHLFQNERNLGIVGNMSRGLDLAKSDCVSIMASDNIMHDSFLSKCIEKFATDKSRNVFVFTDYMLIYESQRRKPTVISMGLFGIGQLDGGLIQASLLYELDFKRIFPPVPLVFSKTTLRSIGGLDNSMLMEDMDLYIRISTRSRFYRIPEVLFTFRQTPGSAGKNVKLMREGVERVLLKNKENIEYDKALLVACAKNSFLSLANYDYIPAISTLIFNSLSIRYPVVSTRAILLFSLYLGKSLAKAFLVRIKFL
jgi:alpha-1,3-rhamnosyltransferase